ncbi:MAG: thermonuclease family protein [Granulosicoccus sp.]
MRLLKTSRLSIDSVAWTVSIALACGVLIAMPAALAAAKSDMTQRPECLLRNKLEAVSIKRVTDGDTVVLSDERRVRLIGINTLELNEKNASDRAWAKEASASLEAFVSGGSIQIVPGIETHDRHGRLLAHLLRSDGVNASHQLVSQGLAIAIAVGKNTRCAIELQTLEQSARETESGLWRNPGAWRVTKDRLTGRERGFRIVHSRVIRSDHHGKRRTLLLENGLLVKVGRHWPVKNRSQQKMLDSIVGKKIRVKGWLGVHAGKSVITLDHPGNILVFEH